jgi:hypothetical protein
VFWPVDDRTVHLYNIDMKKFFENPIVLASLVMLVILLMFELGIA